MLGERYEYCDVTGMQARPLDMVGWTLDGDLLARKQNTTNIIRRKLCVDIWAL